MTLLPSEVGEDLLPVAHPKLRARGQDGNSLGHRTRREVVITSPAATATPPIFFPLSLSPRHWPHFFSRGPGGALGHARMGPRFSGPHGGG
jgi:hypothetical protein